MYLKYHSMLLAMRSVVKEIRKELSIQQKDLAARLEITRQTLTKYEAEPEAIPIPVIKKMAVILGIDYATIIDNKRYDREEEKTETAEEDATQPGNLVTTSEDVCDKFHQVFLYILSKIGAEVGIGKGTLCRMLYFMEYDWYQETGRDLLFIQFIRDQFGPYPLAFDNMIDRMEKLHLLESFISKSFHHDGTKYIPVKAPRLSALTSAECAFLDKEIGKYHSLSIEDYEPLLAANEPYSITEYNPVLEEIIKIF